MSVQRRLVLVPALMLVASILGACGATGSDKGEAMSGDAQKACVKQAIQLRDAKREEPELTALAPFDMKPNKGKSVWVIGAARVPFVQRMADGAEAAGKASGINVKIVYGDGSTNTAQAAVRQATAQGADGIALIFVDPTTIQAAVDDAKKAGITVTDVINRSVGDPMPSGVTGQLVLDMKDEMAAMAGWVMADSKCSANTLMYAPSALPITAAASTFFDEAYKRLCPSCEFELKDLDYGNFSRTLTAEVQTDIRRKPDLGYIFSIVGSTVPNVDAGLRGKKVRVLTHDGLADNLEAMRKKTTHVIADFAFAPSESIGWQIVDQQARLLVGAEGASEIIVPSRLVDKTNVGASDDGIWPGYTDYQRTYTTSWGL